MARMLHTKWKGFLRVLFTSHCHTDIPSARNFRPRLSSIVWHGDSFSFFSSHFFFVTWFQLYCNFYFREKKLKTLKTKIQMNQHHQQSLKWEIPLTTKMICVCNEKEFFTTKNQSSTTISLLKNPLFCALQYNTQTHTREKKG